MENAATRCMSGPPNHTRHSRADALDGAIGAAGAEDYQVDLIVLGEGKNSLCRVGLFEYVK